MDKDGKFLEQETLNLLNGKSSQFTLESILKTSDGVIEKYQHPYKFIDRIYNCPINSFLKVYIIKCKNLEDVENQITGNRNISVPESIKKLGLGKKFIVVVE